MVIYDLIRVRDQSGVSGTGRVAECVVFDNGKAVIAWRRSTPPFVGSIVVYDCIDDAIRVHGHDGDTQFQVRT